MAYLVAGPLVALVGIVAVFFVLRRKSVEKRSMYSARRSQIEHKVRAARQRTLTPRGRSEKPVEQTAVEAPSPFATQAQQTVAYETPAYEPPPMAAPSAPPSRKEPSPAPPAWETTSAPAAPSTFDYPPAPPQPAYTPPSEPFRPAPEPTPMPAPSEQAWTPAPAPASEPVAPLEPAAAASSSATPAGAWSVVSSAKDSSVSGDADGKKRGGGTTSSWQLASGDAPGMEADMSEVKASSGAARAIAQYAVLVVGLVMVLIGVLVMVANSKVN